MKEEEIEVHVDDVLLDHDVFDNATGELHLADQGAGDVDLEHPLLWLHLQSPLVYSGEFIFIKTLDWSYLTLFLSSPEFLIWNISFLQILVDQAFPDMFSQFYISLWNDSWCRLPGSCAIGICYIDRKSNYVGLVTTVVTLLLGRVSYFCLNNLGWQFSMWKLCHSFRAFLRYFNDE